jgi:hypothetical protein
LGGSTGAATASHPEATTQYDTQHWRASSVS